MDEKRTHHLKEVVNSRTYAIADDEPDIKHWNIVDDSAKKIGEVKDILVDTEALKARYLVTNLKDGMFEEDRTVLVPVGRARINREDKRVVLPTVTRGQIASLPEYKGPEHLTGDDEVAIRNAFAEDHATEAYDRKTFYDHKDFDHEAFYGRQRS